MQSEDDEVKLVLPTGELVLKSGRVIKPKQALQPAAQIGREIQSGRAAAATLERVHRKLGDLPETAEKLNAISCVLLYTSIRLADEDIAVALKTSVENIQRLRDLDAYKQLSEMFDVTVFDDAKRTANHIISRHAAVAAQRIVEAVDDEDVAAGKVSAAKEVLRIAGVGTDRADESKISNLNIRVIRKGDKKDDEITVEINNA